MIRLKELRDETKLNMRQTAMILKIPYTTYVSYEKGEREPNSEMLILFANYFKCSVDYLVGRSNERAPDISFSSENLIEDIKKELPSSAKESDRERIVSMIADRLGECPEQDIDDMLMFLDFLDFRRRGE